MNRAKLLIPAVAALAAIAAFWFLALAPKREEISRLDAEITTQEAAATQAEQQAASYQRAKDGYRRNYATLVRLGKAVPGDDDTRSLLVQLDDAAAKSKVSFRTVSLGGGSSPASQSTTGSAVTTPGAVPVGSAGFSAMPFSFGFSGTFFTLSDFFSRLERFVTVENDRIDVTGRLLLLGSIAVTPDGGDRGQLQAQVGAVSYLLSPTQGVAAGATPQTPAADSASSAPADGGTTPNTTASITGVR